MRIIAGTHRHRTILPPRDSTVTRPIIDRVKQSLFDRLWAMGLLGDSPVEFGRPEMVGGGNVLDMFAGTGSLGLEALSRGAEHCTFIEKDHQARELLEKNLETLGLAGQATVLGLDALAGTWVGALAHKPLRLMFCDPPYSMTQDEVMAGRIAGLMETLAGTAELVEEGAVLVLRTDDRAVAAAVKGWTGPESKKYGSMALHIYLREEAKPQAAENEPS